MSRGLGSRRRLKTLQVVMDGGGGVLAPSPNSRRRQLPRTSIEIDDRHHFWMNYISLYFTCNAERHICCFLWPPSHLTDNPNKTRARSSPVDVDKLLSHGQGTGVQVKYRSLQRLNEEGQWWEQGSVHMRQIFGTRTYQNLMYKTQCPPSDPAMPSSFDLCPLEFLTFSQRSTDRLSCPSWRCFNTT